LDEQKRKKEKIRRVHSGDLVRQGLDTIRRTLSNLSAPIIKEFHGSMANGKDESEDEEGLMMRSKKA